MCPDLEADANARGRLEETFISDFQSCGITYHVSDRSKSELYEAFEPLLNAHATVLLDLPILEQQLLGLVWRGGKIDHQGGEHDDWANAVAGSLVTAANVAQFGKTERWIHEANAAAASPATNVENAFGNTSSGFDTCPYQIPGSRSSC